MQLFSGIDYIKIAVANAYGLDRENWDVRLDWFDRHINHLPAMIPTAKEPIKYQKALKAFDDALNYRPTGYLMELDATASGLQVFAALTGCHDTARNTNLLPNYDRLCPYNSTALAMSALSNKTFSRDEVKKPLMTVFYGSKEQPKLIFGDGTDELNAFYGALNQEFKGAVEALADIQSCWQPDQDYHSWTLPDGHVAYVPVRVDETKIIEVDTLGGLKFTQSATVVAPSESGISLAANIVHSVDGYVCREMIRRCYAENFRILTVHDAFFASPNKMNRVRFHYKEILAEIAESNLLSEILSEICDEPLEFTKFSLDLGSAIRESNYALS
jgi:DNA-directed RNA polymerase